MEPEVEGEENKEKEERVDAGKALSGQALETAACITRPIITAHLSV